MCLVRIVETVMFMDSSKTNHSYGKKVPCLPTLSSSIPLTLILFVGVHHHQTTDKLIKVHFISPKMYHCNVLGSIEHYTDFVCRSSQDKVWFNSFGHFTVHTHNTAQKSEKLRVALHVWRQLWIFQHKLWVIWWATWKFWKWLTFHWKTGSFLVCLYVSMSCPHMFSYY